MRHDYHHMDEHTELLSKFYGLCDDRAHQRVDSSRDTEDAILRRLKDVENRLDGHDDATESLDKHVVELEKRANGRDDAEKRLFELHYAVSGRVEELKRAIEAQKLHKEAEETKTKSFFVQQPGRCSVYFSPGHVFYTSDDGALYVYLGQTKAGEFKDGDWSSVRHA